jgi:hypothetical protein
VGVRDGGIRYKMVAALEPRNTYHMSVGCLMIAMEGPCGQGIALKLIRGSPQYDDTFAFGQTSSPS